MSEFYSDITVDLGEGYPIFAFVHLAYANSANGETDFTIEPKDGVLYNYLGQYSDNNRIASTEPSAYAWALLSQEEQRAAAEKARVQNETVREKAESARASAETTRADNEKIRNSNENARITDEDTRKSHETSRVDAEETRTNNELKRAENEKTRISSESARVTAETNRATAESNRSDAETKRVSAESARVTAETNRVSAEKTRSDAEAKRVSAETSRVSAETKRISTETARATAETNRASAESTRATNETNRVNAESKRVSAETARETASATAVSNANTAATNAQKVADTIADSLSAEVTTRTDADAKLQQDINSVTPSRSGILGQVIELPELPPCDDFLNQQVIINSITYYGSNTKCTLSGLADFMNKIGAATVTKYYYSSLNTAIDDLNKSDYSNGSTTALTEGVMIIVQSTEPKYTRMPRPYVAIVLLSDATLEHSVCIEKSCIIDLNGHTIDATISDESFMKSTGGDTTNSIMRFGSLDDNVETAAHYQNLAYYMHNSGKTGGFNFTISSSLPDTVVVNYTIYAAAAAFVMKGCSITIEDKRVSANISTTTVALGMLSKYYDVADDGTYKREVSIQYIRIVENCNITVTVASYPKYGGAGFIFRAGGKSCFTYLKNSNFTVDFSNKAGAVNYSTSNMYIDDQSAKHVAIVDGCTIQHVTAQSSSTVQGAGIDTSGGNGVTLIVLNSTISSTGIGILSDNASRIFVLNSTLEGSEHGGIYLNNKQSGTANMTYTYSSGKLKSLTFLAAICPSIPQVYVQDSTIRKIKNLAGYHDNSYAMYFRGNTDSVFNNVKFENESGSACCPSLASGQCGTARFSNCSMSSIRVDAGATATFGEGIPDAVRKASVNGTIVNKPYECYNSQVFVKWPENLYEITNP